MSVIYANIDIQNHALDITFHEINSFYVDLMVGFNGAKFVQFDNFKFKYELKVGDTIVQYNAYPPPNVTYLCTDQPHIIVERLNLRPDNTYNLWLWGENANASFENTFTFTAPRPESPYASWVWNGDYWEAPIAKPEDTNKYKWNESITNWEEVTL